MLYKTTIIVWTPDNQAKELEEGGVVPGPSPIATEAYCTKVECVPVENPLMDPDYDQAAHQYFNKT